MAPDDWSGMPLPSAATSSHDRACRSQQRRAEPLGSTFRNRAVSHHPHTIHLFPQPTAMDVTQMSLGPLTATNFPSARAQSEVATGRILAASQAPTDNTPPDNAASSREVVPSMLRGLTRDIVQGPLLELQRVVCTCCLALRVGDRMTSFDMRRRHGLPPFAARLHPYHRFEFPRTCSIVVLPHSKPARFDLFHIKPTVVHSGQPLPPQRLCLIEQLLINKLGLRMFRRTRIAPHQLIGTLHLHLQLLPPAGVARRTPRTSALYALRCHLGPDALPWRTWARRA